MLPHTEKKRRIKASGNEKPLYIGKAFGKEKKKTFLSLKTKDLLPYMEDASDRLLKRILIYERPPDRPEKEKILIRMKPSGQI